MPRISSRPCGYKLNSWIMVDKTWGNFERDSFFFLGDAIKWNNHLLGIYGLRKCETGRAFVFVSFAISSPLEIRDPTWLLWQMLSSVRNQVPCSFSRIDFVGNEKGREEERKGLFTLGKWSFPKISETFLAQSLSSVGKLSSTISNVFSAERVCLSFPFSRFASFQSSKFRKRGIGVRKMGPVAFHELEMTSIAFALRENKSRSFIFWSVHEAAAFKPQTHFAQIWSPKHLRFSHICDMYGKQLKTMRCLSFPSLKIAQNRRNRALG